MSDGFPQRLKKLREQAARMCPACGESSVVYRSMELPDGTILRRRRCRGCGTEFETSEKFLQVLHMARQNGDAMR